MSVAQNRLDEILAPILKHADEVEATEPQKAYEIRKLAGKTRVELAQLEAVAIEMGVQLIDLPPANPKDKPRE